LGENIASWGRYDDLVKEAYKKIPSLKNSRYQPLSKQFVEIIEQQLIKSRAVTEYKKISGVTHSVQLHHYWCAMACAEMISKYYGVIRTQADIASQMGCTTEQGATNQQEVDYYQTSKASGGLGKSNSRDYYILYWYDVKDEINNNRPFRIHNTGHARVCTGYWRSGSTDLTYVYFYDPKKSSSIYWEWINEFNPHYYADNIRIK